MNNLENIIIALMSLSGTCIGTLGGILASSRLTNYRLQQLEDKVEKHNSIIERVFNLEKQEAVIEEEIKVANHRIGDLERKFE